MGISAKTQQPDKDLGFNANLGPTNNSSKGQAKNDPNSRAGTSSSKAKPIEGDGVSRQNPQLPIKPDAAKPSSQQSPEACSNTDLGATDNSSKTQTKDPPNSQAGTSSSKATPIEGDGAALQSPQLPIKPDAAKPSSQRIPEACKSNPASKPEIVTQPPAPNTQKKQASFSNHVNTVDIDNAIDSDSEGDYIDESAIDDDDSSEWEDTNENSSKSSVDDKYFQRVDSKVNLTSRRSLITLMLTQTEDRAKALSNHASQSTSAVPQSRNRNGAAFAVSPNDSDDAPLIMKGNRQAP
uniref:DUF3295 domain-containing protein n=1 Tax=Bionectria ochroleuca TaxID=29856 RepID=A0A8H7K8N3_BIOOC